MNRDTHADERDAPIILTRAVKAGRRTYFFDVRSTRKEDYFLTITESRKITDAGGGVSYDRHKLFLFKEDFAKFAAGLDEVIDFIRRRVQPDLVPVEPMRAESKLPPPRKCGEIIDCEYVTKNGFRL